MNTLTPESAAVLRKLRPLTQPIAVALEKLEAPLRRGCEHKDHNEPECPVCALLEMVWEVTNTYNQFLKDFDSHLTRGPKPQGGKCA